MARTFVSTIFIAAALSGAAACDINGLNVCSETAKTTVNVGIAAGKTILCGALSQFEACFIAKGSDCEASVKVTMQQEIQATRNYLTGKLGVECSGAGPTPIPLMSGDSGMPSGSVGRKSSASSAYGFLAWQAVVLVLCICCCCAAAAGGGGYYMNSKKKKPSKPARREYEPVREEEVPLASVEVDRVYADGSMTEQIITGVDMNRDGIPDVLQGVADAPYQVVAEASQPAPVVYEEPSLFGATPQLMYQQPVVTAAPMATYGAYPTATSNYATGYPAYPATTSNYTSGYAAPMATGYAQAAPMATGYAQSYSPQYATTGYTGVGGAVV